MAMVGNYYGCEGHRINGGYEFQFPENGLQFRYLADSLTLPQRNLMRHGISSEKMLASRIRGSG